VVITLSVTIWIQNTPHEELLFISIIKLILVSEDNNKLLLQSVVEMCDKNLDNLLFIGDFKLPGIDWHNWSSSTNNQLEIDFINMLRDCYLLQHVSCPTKFRGANTLHVLDLVISIDSFVEEVIYLAPLGNSNHSVIYVTIGLKKVN